MSLRRDLETLVASWPHSEARSALRVADILAGKPADYWSRIGRERVERELAEDGLSLEQMDRVMAVEGEGVPSEVSLDAILEDLKRREGVT